MAAWTPQWTIPTLGQGTIARSATMQVRTIWDTDAHATQVANECVFISGPTSMPRLAVMMAANPNLIFAPYLKSIQNPATSGAFDATATKYPNKWYVHMKDGTKAKQGGQFLNWIMESGYWAESHAAVTVGGALSGGSLAAASWAEYHVKDAVLQIQHLNGLAANGGLHPWRGLWFDTNDTFSADATAGTGGSGPFWGPTAGGTSTNPGWNPHTLAAYLKPDFVAMAHWVGDMAQNQTAAGIVNAERLFTVANGLRSVSIADHYDMAMAEGWQVSGGLGGSMTRGATGWAHPVDLALQCQAKGCVAEILEWGVATDTLAVDRQKRRFLAASYLIAHRGLATMEYGTLKSTAPHLETAKDTALYALDLGAPLTGQSPVTAAGHLVAVGSSNGQASATGLFARLYDGGTSLVNPTANTINYKASKTYTLVPEPGFGAASYVAGNLIPVLAGHGVLLTTSGGTGGGTAPSNTLVPDATGTPREGNLVRRDPGVWTGQPAPAVSAKWQQSANGTTGWADIAGAVGDSVLIPIVTGSVPSTTIAHDDFSDIEVDTWASADVGGAWIILQAAPSAEFDKTGGVGTISHSGANTTRYTKLAVSQTDGAAVVDISWPSTPTGGNLEASLALRQQDVSNNLRMNCVLDSATGHLNVTPQKVVAGVITALGSAKDLGVYSAAAWVSLRFRLEGSHWQAKAWLRATSEPGSWDWDFTDTSILTSGDICVRSYRGGGNTNASPQSKWDNLDYASIGSVGSGGTSWVGTYLRVRESAVNATATVTADSPATTVVVTAITDAPVFTTLPAVTGTPREGQVLTATTGAASGLGTTGGGGGGGGGGFFGAGLQIGVSPGPRSSRNRAQELAFLDSEVSPAGFGHARIYNQMDWPGPNAEETAIDLAGREMLMSFGLKAGGTNWTYASIALGSHDAAIDSLGNHVKTFVNNGTVGKMKVAFNHEPENNTSQGSAADYSSACQRIITRWRNLGVTNVEYVMIFMGFTFSTASSHHADLLTFDWGDSFADAWYVDAYNWYTAAGHTDPWRTFAQVMANFKTWMAANKPAMPIGIGEVATATDPANASRAPQWITDMLTTLKTSAWANTEAVMWFNSKDQSGYPWYFDQTPAMTAAMRTVMNDPFVAAWTPA